MSNLTIRNPNFDFEGVEFLWNPSNPAFSVQMNTMSFWVIALERYMVRAMKDAGSVITDEAVHEEASKFLEQEAIHSKAHRRHVRALIERYPGLSGALDTAIGHYDELYDRKDLRYHLAYAAALEGTFTAIFGGFIDHRESLFRQGDARVASLCLWHFCEEIEHRSSAVRVYDHVIDDRGLHRLRVLPSLLVHINEAHRLLFESFRTHVPGEADSRSYAPLPARLLGRRANPLATVPARDRLRMFGRAMRSFRPSFDHDNQPVPEWCDTWFANYDAGVDMTTFYGTAIDRTVE